MEPGTGLISGAGEGEHVRARILAAAAQIIAEEGPDFATTRAIATAAAVQAPTIYRLFGDKRGLLDAVAESQFAAYVVEKSAAIPHVDPVQDLRNGWDMHVAFGLAHPGLFAIMSGNPRRVGPSPAMAAGAELLRERIRNIARAGRLRVSEERAVALLQSMGVGTVLTLLTQPVGRRDVGLSETAREAVIVAITGESSSSSDSVLGGAAVTLRAALDEISVLTAGERGLLEELLDRIAERT